MKIKQNPNDKENQKEGFGPFYGQFQHSKVVKPKI